MMMMMMMMIIIIIIIIFRSGTVARSNMSWISTESNIMLRCCRTGKVWDPLGPRVKISND
jgi:hypothetical protein